MLAQMMLRIILCAAAAATCKTGEYEDGTTEGHCIKCAVGKFADTSIANTAENHCKVCETGRFAAVTGMSACLPCEACAQGKFRDGCGADSAGVCADCGGGKYKPINTEGLDSTTGSPILNSCLECPSGQFSSAVSPRCTNCSIGHYAAKNSSQECTVCETGRYQEVEGMSECINCATCPPGAFGTGCISSSKGAGCSLCAIGQFKSGKETWNATCASCEAGMFADVTGLVLCKSCPAGKFVSETGAVGCEFCGAGFYAPLAGADTCAACATCTAGSALKGCVGESAGSCQVCLVCHIFFFFLDFLLMAVCSGSGYQFPHD